MGRMEANRGAEGSSQVRYGPRTTGGAIKLPLHRRPCGGKVGVLGPGEAGRRSAHGSFKARGSAGWAGDHVGLAWWKTYQLSTAGIQAVADRGRDRDTGAGLSGERCGLNTDRDAPLYQEVG